MPPLSLGLLGDRRESGASAAGGVLPASAVPVLLAGSAAGGGSCAELPPQYGSEILTEFPRVVHLNVGGHRFMTTLATLRAEPGSMLGRMFSGEHPVLRDVDGSFVIDRDGRHFHHILNYLRDGSVPIGLSRVDRIELLREIDFYGMRTLYQVVGGPTVASAQLTGGGNGAWLHGLIADLARSEAAEFSACTHSHRVYARVRFGTEYSGDWIVSSPRNLPNVDYELYDACLGRDAITALNRMGAAGFRPCVDPPPVPLASQSLSDSWEILMYKDVLQ
eukprot:TRINITY_DN28758_c0_g1_i1.p1 TRINITY_DN28758_c0_g1~~TRINITY_DN28758_c0_g1_i1.p1  ORF type:complete len:277 (+),score=54.69 TRINITY_DN28758_c0_g1_i1:82-912(+)